MHVAFVAYRDHCDGARRIQTLPFTEDVGQFQSFVGHQSAGGGGDAPEDVLGGLETAAALKWRSPTRVLWLIGDAPPHGREYHDMGDDHPGGCPRGLTAERVIARIVGKNISMFFGRITRFTDKMVEIFGQHLPGKELPCMAIGDGDIDKLLGHVSDSVSAGISATVSAVAKTTRAGDGSRRLRRYTIDRAMPAFDAIVPTTCTMVCCILPRTMADVKRRLRFRKSKRLVKIAPRPFAEGSMRCASYGLDVTSFGSRSLAAAGSAGAAGAKVVLKEFRHCRADGSPAYGLQHFFDEVENHTIAQFLAREFSKEIAAAGVGTVTRLAYNKAYVYIPDDARDRPLHCEALIEGDYAKWTNNVMFVKRDPHAEPCAAFSHWSYERTDGDLMVVDVQGVHADGVFRLTDPAVHFRDLLRGGRTNLGCEGMNRFFESHKCNGVCRALGLPPHRTMGRSDGGA